MIGGKSAEETLQAARKVWPAAAPGEIQRTADGVFTITVLWPESNAFSFGARPITFR